MLRNKRIIILLMVLMAIALWWYLDLGRYLQLQAMQDSLSSFRRYYDDHPAITALAYFAIYVVVTGLSLPGAAVMTLAGGALFGFWYGLLLVSFASTVGATVAFSVSRLLLRDWVQQRFSRQLVAVDAAFERDGGFYLFTLRLVPLFPFFVINLVMGLLPISSWRFYWISQLGMLAGTAVFVNAGTQLARLDSVAGIISPPLLFSFILLGVFPLLARLLVSRIQANRALKGFKKPGQFDDNLIVIGAGSAGLVASLIAATVNAKVSLVERHRMGGDCLNTGCVPSKALIRSARIADYLRRAPEFGLATGPVQVDFTEVMQRVQAIIKKIEPHDSVERFTSLGVNCISGSARLVSPWEVEIDGKRRSARNIIVAAGARPRVPAITGIEDIDYLTSDTVWELRQAPEHMLVLGAGPIGCELAQAMVRLGIRVTLVTHAKRVLPREDVEVSQTLQCSLERQGMVVLTSCEPLAFKPISGAGVCGEFRDSQGTREIHFDRLLIATGRETNVEQLGLNSVGVEITDKGTILVDDYMRTSVPTVFACGDIAGPYQFTHMASHQAWYATVNALFGRFRKFRVDYSIVPWATFTDPEVARVGLNEQDAQEQDIAYEVSQYHLDDLDRAIADGEAHGFIKVLTVPGKDRILGATIVGYHAAELVNEFVLAMKHNIGLNRILSTIHIYPTLSEGNKFLASEWRKARKPEKLLAWVGRYHSWMRG